MTATPVNTEAKLQRATERLYVLCQAGGWGIFLASQFAFSRVFADEKAPVARDRLTDSAIIVFIVLLGMLLTHYTRPWMSRWGWKQLGQPQAGHQPRVGRRHRAVVQRRPAGEAQGRPQGRAVPPTGAGFP